MTGTAPRRGVLGVDFFRLARGGNMATKTGLGVTRSQLEAGRKKIAAELKAAPLDDLCQQIPADIAALLGAGSVRLFLRDPLTEELYARAPEGRRVRETRVALDPS